MTISATPVHKARTELILLKYYGKLTYNKIKAKDSLRRGVTQYFSSGFFLGEFHMGFLFTENKVVENRVQEAKRAISKATTPTPYLYANSEDNCFGPRQSA